MRTISEIAELLHDAGTHASGWEKVLRRRAEAPGTPEEDRERIHEAAERVLSGGVSFRGYEARAHEPELPGLILAVDRLLLAAPLLRETLERDREEALNADPEGGDASYYAHELRALDALRAARIELITPPDPQTSPIEELGAIQRFATLLGREIMIDFEGGADGHRIEVDLGPAIPLEAGGEMGPRISRLADRLIRCEIPDWDEAPGSSGRIRISAQEDPWLDGVDHAEDWLLERTIDLDTLEEIGWGDDPDTDPSP
jgi:hypothetical protein